VCTGPAESKPTRLSKWKAKYEPIEYLPTTPLDVEEHYCHHGPRSVPDTPNQLDILDVRDIKRATGKTNIAIRRTQQAGTCRRGDVIPCYWAIVLPEVINKAKQSELWELYEGAKQVSSHES
jgi:hypothetical protein